MSKKESKPKAASARRSRAKRPFRNWSIWRLIERRNVATLRELSAAGYVFVPKAEAGIRGEVPHVPSHDPMQRLINLMAARGFVMVHRGNAAAGAPTPQATAGAGAKRGNDMAPVSGIFLTVREKKGDPPELLLKEDDGGTRIVRGANLPRELQKFSPGDKIRVSQTGWDGRRQRKFRVERVRETATAAH